MSTNSNFKKDKCWSCEFYCARREYKKGYFLGDSVETDYRGRCTNKRSRENNREVSEDGWCSNYQKWGVLQSHLELEKQKREMETLKALNEKERRRLQEQQREYSSYEPTPSYHQEMTEEEYRKRQKESEINSKEVEIINKNKTIESLKKRPAKVLTLGIISTVVLFGLGWIPFAYYSAALKGIKEEIQWHQDMGHDPNSEVVRFLYEQGLKAKEAMNNSIWIPIVILLVGAAITVASFFVMKKSSSRRIETLNSEIKKIEEEIANNG